MDKTYRFIMCCTVALCTFLASCAPAGQRIDNIPMYGQPAIPRPELLKKADEDFINNATAGFGSREVASKAWYLEGQKFMDAGNLDYAMRRYNQSWLLNPKNYQPYWGFGRVMVALGKFDEAIEYFEKSKQLIDDQYQKVALLSDTAVAFSQKASKISATDQKEAATYFTIANEHYQQSTALDPSYPHSWRNWGWSLYREGRYAEAWEKAKKARSLGDAFVPKLIEKLSQKMPEPQ